MSDFMETLQLWLPDVHYPFYGGPFDGARRAVEMTEFRDGLYPPRYVRLPEPYRPPLPSAAPVDNCEAEFKMVTYKFVRRGPVANQGYYQWCPGE